MIDGLGKSPGQIAYLADLWMIDPGVERQTQRRQGGEALSERLICEQPLGRDCRRRPNRRARVAGRRMPDAAEATVAGGDMGLEHRPGTIAKEKINMADDAGACSRRSIETACAHGGAAIDKFGLADRSVLDRAVCAIHRRGLHKHCRFHVVAGVHVGEEFRQKVAIERPVHQMMMGVDDRQIGLNYLFA